MKQKLLWLLATAVLMIPLFMSATTGKQLTFHDMALQDSECKSQCGKAGEFSGHKFIGQTYAAR